MFQVARLFDQEHQLFVLIDLLVVQDYQDPRQFVHTLVLLENLKLPLDLLVVQIVQLVRVVVVLVLMQLVVQDSVLVENQLILIVIQF